VEGAAKQLRIMQGNLAAVGFKKQDLKTNDFTINPDYEDFRDENGNYTRHFLGYKVNQSLSLSFPLDMETLSASEMVICFKDGRKINRTWIQPKQEGKPWTDEQRAKFKKSIQKSYTPERRKQMSEHMKQIRKERGKAWRKEE